MKLLIAASLSLFASGPSDDVYHRIPIRDLVIVDGELPQTSPELSWRAWSSCGPTRSTWI